MSVNIAKEEKESFIFKGTMKVKAICVNSKHMLIVSI